MLIYHANLMREMLELILKKEKDIHVVSVREKMDGLERDLHKQPVDCVIVQYSLWTENAPAYRMISDRHPEVNFIAISSDADRVFFRESFDRNEFNLSDLFGLMLPDNIHPTFSSNN